MTIRITLMASAIACASLGGAVCGIRRAGVPGFDAGDIRRAARVDAVGLWSVYERVLSRARYVDLTHTFGPNTPHWRGFGSMTVRRSIPFPRTAFTSTSTATSASGAHTWMRPRISIPGLRTIDQIAPSEMLLPLVVIDVHEQVARNPDYMLSMQDVHAWERRHGRIPAHAFVAMRTDWSKRWPNQAAMQNVDAKGVGHYPAWSMPVLKFLYRAASRHRHRP